MIYFLLLFVGAGALRASSPAGAITYLVFPPENLSGSASLAWVGEALAFSISEQLRVPGIEVLSREDRLNFVEGADLPPNAALSRASMIHVAQSASADRLAMGSYVGSDENLQVSLRVLDVKSMKLGREIVIGGPSVALPEIENQLAWTLLVNAGVSNVISRERFRERTRAIPNEAYSYFVRSFSQSEPEEQAKLLTRAVELFPGFPEAQSRLGAYYYAQADCAKSIPHLELVVGSRANSLDDRFKLGTCYLKQGNLPEAIRSLAGILEFVKSPQVMNNLGVAYLRKGDYTLAAESLIEARNAAQTEATILMNLALVRYLQGDYAGARSILEEAARLDPKRGMAPFLLGSVWGKLGDPEKAGAAMAEAKRLGLDPDKLSSDDPKTWARPFNLWTSGQ
jgi:Flp pilus assembly protein TadD